MQFGKYCLFSMYALLLLSANIVNAENNSNISKNTVVISQNTQTEIKETEDIKESKNRNNTNTDNIKNNKTHIVQNGENVYRISLKYNIKQDELIKLNNIKNNFIKVGQKLVLPHNAIINQVLTNKQEANTTANNNTNDVKINEKKEEKTKSANNTKSKDILMSAKIEQQTTNDKNKKNDDITNNQSTQTIHQSTFIWPVHGVIVSKFGSVGKNNVMLEGNNIATEKDAVVRASSSGVISYNDKVEGYDNVVLIKHYNGFFTAYGHIDSMVNVGDKVIKGQVIGYVRPTANSKRSILYFSIRKQNKSYDPEKIIQSKIDD